MASMGERNSIFGYKVNILADAKEFNHLKIICTDE